jgi:hypothetical protein
MMTRSEMKELYGDELRACYHREREWLASCNTCTLPIYSDDEYSQQQHNEAAPYIWSTFTCEDCLTL